MRVRVRAESGVGVRVRGAGSPPGFARAEGPDCSAPG